MGYETYGVDDLLKLERDFESHRKSLEWAERTHDSGLTAQTARSNLRETVRTLNAIRHELASRVLL